MGTQYTPDRLYAFLLPSARSTSQYIDDTRTTATQAGPVPNRATTVSAGYMRLDPFGTADGELTYTVLAQKEGTAVGGTIGGRYVWADENDASDNYKGWLSFNKLRNYRYVQFLAAAGVYSDDYGYRFPHAVKLPDHRLVVVYDDQQNDEIRCQVKANEGATAGYDGSYGSAVTVAGKGSGGWHAYPVTVRLPGGRLLCIYLRDDYTEAGTTYWTLATAYSDNDGATWTAGSQRIEGWDKANAANTVPVRLRAVYHSSGYLTIVVSFVLTTGPTTTIYHLVSKDLGASVIEINAGSEPGFDAAWDLLVMPDGNRVALFTRESAGAADLQLWVKESPNQSFASDPAGGDILTDCGYNSAGGGAVAATLADDGYIYLYYQSDASRNDCRLAKIDPLDFDIVTDEDRLLYSGRSVTTNGVNLPWDLSNDNSEHIRDMMVVPYREGLRMFGNPGGQGSVNGSLIELQLGAYHQWDWQNQTYGMRTDSGGPQRSGMVFLPFSSPVGLTGWTVATGGTAPTLSFSANGMELTASSGTWTMARNGTGSGDEPWEATIVQRMTSAASLAQDDCALYGRIGDNSAAYGHFSLRLSNTSARLYDNGAAAQIGSDITGLTDGQHHAFQVRAELEGANRKVIVLYKDDPDAPEWTEGPSGTLAVVAAAAGNRVQYGHRVNASGTFTGSSALRFFGSSIDEEAQETYIPQSSWSNPDLLIGRPFSIYQQWLDRGVVLASVGGAAFRNDSWQIDTHYDQGVKQACVDVDSSQSAGWVGTSDASEQSVVWDLGETTSLGSSSWGVFIARPRFGQVVVETSTDGSSWTTRGTFNLFTEFNGVTADRNGDTFTPRAGTSAGTRYVQRDEWVGGYLVADTTITLPPSTTYNAFEIVGNTEGAWTDSTTRQVHITVSDNSGNELTTVSTTPDIYVIPPRALLVLHNQSYSLRYVRLRVPAKATTAQNTTPEGAFGASVLLYGPFVVHGQVPSWGRTRGMVGNEDRTTLRDGAVVASRRGSPARSVTHAWSDGWDATRADTDPAYINAKTGYDAIAAKYDPTVIEAAVAHCLDKTLPIVVCDDLPTAEGADTIVVTARDLLIYGLPDPSTNRSAILGSPGASEVMVLDPLTVDELP